jgi:glutathione S-transferase
MKLYHHPFSSNARKALMAAKALELPVELVHVALEKGEQRNAEFLALNPNGAVPVLVDGDLVLPESHAIMIYLAEKAGETGEILYPRSFKGHAQVHRWLFWASNHMGPSIAGLNFENNLKKLFGMGEADAAQVERHERFFNQFATVLDGHMAHRTWVATEDATLADYALAAPLMYEEAAKLPMASFVHLRAWFSRVRELPAWRATDPFAG